MNTDEPTMSSGYQDPRQQQEQDQKEQQQAEQLDQRRAALEQAKQEHMEAQKTPMQKAMEQVLQASMQREQENELTEAGATAFFLNQYIKKKQDEDLNKKLAQIRRANEIRNLQENVVALDFKTKTDQLFNSEAKNYQGTEVSEEEEYKLAQQNIRNYVRARDTGHTDFVKSFKTALRYYEGNQWKEEDLQYLREAKRPALTINKILPIVNSIISLKLKETSVFVAQAVSMEDIQIAEILSKLLVAICKTTKYPVVENRTFKDCLISGRGFAELRISFDKNVEGDIKITRLNPEEVLLDPDSSGDDPNDWSQIIITKWLSLDDIEIQYGENKAKRVEDQEIGSNFTMNDDMFVFSEDATDTFGSRSANYDSLYQATTDEDRRQVKCVRVISRQYRKTRQVVHFLDPVTKECRPIPNTWEAEQVIEFANKNSYHLLTKTIEGIRWTTTAGNIVLHDSWSPYRSFTVVPIFCYTSNTSKTFGVIDNLISPQEQLNKIESQETHVINTTANSGWLVEEDTLVNMTAEELAYYGSVTGVVLEYKRNAKNPPVKIQPNNVPPALANASARAGENITAVSGIDSTFLGIGKAVNTSAASIDRKFDKVKDTYAILNEQLRVFRQNVGAKLIELIQDFYNDTRVFCITDPTKSGDNVERVVINEPHPLEDSLRNNITVGDYTIAVKVQPEATSLDNIMFDQILKMKEAGIGIPAYRAILSSDLVNKAEIAEEVRRLEGLAPPSEEEQQMQQMKMQAEMEQIKLSLQKLQAEIQNLVTESMLNSAKANSEAAKPDIAASQTQAKLIEANINSNLRTNLARVSSETELVKADMANQAGMLKEQMKAGSKIDTEKQKTIGNLAVGMLPQNQKKPAKE